jgi:hypothetical protein
MFWLTLTVLVNSFCFGLIPFALVNLNCLGLVNLNCLGLIPFALGFEVG